MDEKMDMKALAIPVFSEILDGMEFKMRQAVGGSIMEEVEDNKKTFDEVEKILADLHKLIGHMTELSIPYEPFAEKIDAIANLALLIVL